MTRDDSLLDDGLDSAFGDEGGFAQTMTGIAAAIGNKFSGSSETLSPEPEPEPTEIALPEIGSESTTGGRAPNPKALAMAVGVILAIAGVAWFALSSNDAPPTGLPDSSLPRIVESDIALPSTAAPVRLPEAEPVGLFADAREALAAGRLVSPPADNAIELYVAALQAAPENPLIGVELDGVVEQVFGMAESAILDGDLASASEAIRALQIASPENPRLAFLTAQLSQMQVRNKMDEARLAIRDDRFEDAGAAILGAKAVSGGDTAELQSLSDELAAARSEQEVDEVLALANARLEQNRIIQPSNDNARYYYELALSNDPDNTAARQGLTIIASKLVLQARDAIDGGQLTRAEGLLDTARSLDPSSSELTAPMTALVSAKAARAKAEAIAEAERLAEQRRLVEERRIAEAQRIAEEQRIAEAQRAAEELRIAEANRIVEEQRLAEAQRVAEEQRIAENNRIAEQRRAAAAAASLAVASGVGNTAGKPTNAQLGGNTNKVDDRVIAGTTAVNIAANTGATGIDIASAGVAVPDFSTANEKRTDDGQLVARNNPTGTRDTNPAVVTPAIENSRSIETVKPAETPKPVMVPVSSLTRLNYVAPKYPRSARRRNITGSVDVGFTVLRNGRVANITVLASKPGTIFDEAAMDAVAGWRFEPSIEGGQPVEKKTAVRLAFTLQ